MIVAPGDMILVAGATGGVGQLLTKFLLDVSQCHLMAKTCIEFRVHNSVLLFNSEDSV